MSEVTARLLLLLVLSLGAAGVAAQEIYRWVDADGVTHFSDTPPQTDIGEVETIDIEINAPAAGEVREDLFNIEATAARMQAIRDELDEDLDARRDRQRSVSPPVVQYPEYPYYGVGYGFPLHSRPPGLRPPHPRPPRPEPRPSDDTATWRPPGRADG